MTMPARIPKSIQVLGLCIQRMKEIRLCMTGWLNYYAIASMKQRNGAMGRMAAAPNPGAYLEAMEETQDQTPKSEETERS